MTPSASMFKVSWHCVPVLPKAYTSMQTKNYCVEVSGKGTRNRLGCFHFQTITFLPEEHNGRVVYLMRRHHVQQVLISCPQDRFQGPFAHIRM